MYLKIAIARWANTAVVIFIITPFTYTLNEELLKQVYTVLFADVVTYPLFRVCDNFSGYAKKFILAPMLGKNQALMNSYFSGTEWSVAERYTDITKTMFLAFFYAPVYPASYIFCSMSLLLNFCVDRYCLFRLWKQHPKTGTQVSKKAFLFIIVSILAHAILSAYWWSGFPYDNLCINDENDLQTTSEVIETTSGLLVTIPAGPVLSYCDQVGVSK